MKSVKDVSADGYRYIHSFGWELVFICSGQLIRCGVFGVGVIIIIIITIFNILCTFFRFSFDKYISKYD